MIGEVSKITADLSETGVLSPVPTLGGLQPSLALALGHPNPLPAAGHLNTYDAQTDRHSEARGGYKIL